MGLKIRRFLPSAIFSRLCSESRWLSILAVILLLDWLLSSYFQLPTSIFTLTRLAVEDEQQMLAEDMRPAEAGKEFTPVTINQLISKLKLHNIPPFSFTPVFSNNRNESGRSPNSTFTFQRIFCNQLQMVRGERSHFQICYPPKLLSRQRDRLAYFINGGRDTRLEQNFNRMLIRGTKLKVFTQLNNVSVVEQSSSAFGPDLVEDVRVAIYAPAATEEVEEGREKSRKVVGIKDLLDMHDDYHKLEFIKFEMHTKIEPIIFSINPPVFAAHLLLRLQCFSIDELRTLLLRLAQAQYLPYALEQEGDDAASDVLFMSLMHKYSMHKYKLKEGGASTMASWPLLQNPAGRQQRRRKASEAQKNELL